MTTSKSAGMTVGMMSEDSEPAAKLTREEWEAEVKEARKQQESDTIGEHTQVQPEPVDEVDAKIERALARERAKHEKEMQATLARVPQLNVPAHSGGPGSDNHQVSWSLAEQEAAMRGERLDHWE